MLNEKLQHFLNKECPYCPVQFTAFLLFSLLPPLSVMKEGKGEGTDDKKKNMEEENRNSKRYRISQSLWKSFYKHVEKSKKCKHFQIWENVIVKQRWKRKSTPFQVLKMLVLKCKTSPRIIVYVTSVPFFPSNTFFQALKVSWLIVHHFVWGGFEVVFIHPCVSTSADKPNCTCQPDKQFQLPLSLHIFSSPGCAVALEPIFGFGECRGVFTQAM